MLASSCHLPSSSNLTQEIPCLYFPLVQISLHHFHTSPHVVCGAPLPSLHFIFLHLISQALALSPLAPWPSHMSWEMEYLPLVTLTLGINPFSVLSEHGHNTEATFNATDTEDGKGTPVREDWAVSHLYRSSCFVSSQDFPPTSAFLPYSLQSCAQKVR